MYSNLKITALLLLLPPLLFIDFSSCLLLVCVINKPSVGIFLITKDSTVVSTKCSVPNCEQTEMRKTYPGVLSHVQSWPLHVPFPSASSQTLQEKQGFGEKKGLFCLKQLGLPAENPWLLVLFKPALAKAWQIPAGKKHLGKEHMRFWCFAEGQHLHVLLVYLGSNSSRLGGIWNFWCWRWLKFPLSCLVLQFLWLWKEAKCCLCSRQKGKAPLSTFFSEPIVSFTFEVKFPWKYSTSEHSGRVIIFW